MRLDRHLGGNDVPLPDRHCCTQSHHAGKEVKNRLIEGTLALVIKDMQQQNIKTTSKAEGLLTLSHFVNCKHEMAPEQQHLELHSKT